MKTVFVLKKAQVFCNSIETTIVGVFSTEERLKEYVNKQDDHYNYYWNEIEIDKLL